MTVVEHLQELRRRLLISVVAFFVLAIVAYAFYTPILDFLTAPLEEGERIGNVTVEGLNVPGITTAFNMRIKVSMFAGLVLALPFILWQVWRFIVPGLEAREKRYALGFVLSAVVLFTFGAWLAFLVLPQAIGFLLGFAGPPLKPLIFIDQYLSFVIFMILAFGLSFQYPLLLLFLAGIGMLSSARLRSWRRYAFFLSFVLAAVATPSGDPLSMTLMAVPLYLLYEGTQLVVRFAMRR